MPHVEGTKEQMKTFMKLDIRGPIHMLNMLRFNADGGREKYRQYGKHTAPLLAKVGAKVISRSEARATLIGGEDWDAVLVVEYPSRMAFLDMVLSEEFKKGKHLRHEALEDSRLICMQVNSGK
jgi:uncharacterized protein (DUF1330 family)